MSSLLEYITSNPQETKRLIGIDEKQLQQLILQAEAHLQQKQAVEEEVKIRIITHRQGKETQTIGNRADIIDISIFAPSTNISTLRRAI